MKLASTPGRRLADLPAYVMCEVSPVAALVVRPVVTISADATLGEAVAAMEENGVSALVVDDGAGILTERDLALAFGHGASLDEVVDIVATPNPITVPGSTSVVDACALMLLEHVRHLIVDLDGSLGVLSIRDVAAVLLQTAHPQIWLTGLRIDMPSECWLG